MADTAHVTPEDELRPDQQGALAAFRAAGFKVEVSAGDSASIVHHAGVGCFPNPPGPYCAMRLDSAISLSGGGRTVVEAFDDLVRRARDDHDVVLET